MPSDAVDQDEDGDIDRMDQRTAGFVDPFEDLPFDPDDPDSIFAGPTPAPPPEPMPAEPMPAPAVPPGARGRTDGIDVAKYQGVVDWAKVKQSGVTWVGIKATLGRTVVDPKFASNRRGIEQTGFRHRLLYHWLTPSSTVKAQVDNFFGAVGALGTGEGVMLDAEQSGITAEQCLDWCERVEARTGRPVAVYTGGYVAGGTIWKSKEIYDGRRARVFAAYCSIDKARHHARNINWDAWQFIGTGGRCPGVSSTTPVHCDLDQVDNPAAFDRACGLTGGRIIELRATGVTEAEEEEDMAYVLIERGSALSPKWSAVFACYESGKVRHVGQAESEFLQRLGVPRIPTQSEEEFRFLHAASGTIWMLPVT